MNMQLTDLKNKKIIVTGATRGIGKEIALSLANQHAFLLLNYRASGEESAQKLKQELLAKGASGVELFLMDLNNNQEIGEAAKKLMNEHSDISGLVNNAGMSKDQLFMRLKESDLTQIMQVNLLGPMLFTSSLSRIFLKNENVSIVNMSSVVGLMGNISQVSYSASKSALLGFTKSLAKELGSRNIRCNAICPGFIETEMTETLSGEVKENYLSNIPLKRFGSAQEVSNLVNFLLSTASSYITGEVIKIDGGLYT